MRPKWQAFIDSYFINRMNATDAYCNVYGVGRAKGEASGSRLLSNVIIQEAIKRRLDENAMSANEVLHRLADIGRGDLADLMAISTSGFTLELMLDDGAGNKVINPKTKLIKKIKQKVTTFLGKKEDDEDREVIETEVELYSAHDALRDIGKYHSIFLDRTDLTTNGKDLPTSVVNVYIPDNSRGNDNPD